MPELADASKMKDFAGSTVGYLRDVGFADTDIAELLDHKALLIVDKARRWDAQQKAKAALPAKKIVPVSQAKTLRSDASDGSKNPRRPPSPTASRDAKTDYVVKELLDQFGT
jgi:hypothetical protein